MASRNSQLKLTDPAGEVEPRRRNRVNLSEPVLRARRNTLTLADFNALNRRIDRLIVPVANEPSREQTRRPLDTLLRRIGYIRHTHMAGQSNLDGTVDHHLAADRRRQPSRGTRGSRVGCLMDFVDGMFDAIEAEIDPSLLDKSIEPLLVG